ncbi:MAG: hypothetical protein V7749_11215 [Cocleimonas sp.]
MFITKGKASTAVNWFLKNDEEHDLFGVFLGVSQDDHTKCKQFVDRFHQLDAAMGDKVIFLVCASDSDNIIGFPEGSNCNVFPGEFLTKDNDYKPYYPVRKTKSLGPDFAQKEAKEIIANKMQSIVQDFLDRYSNIQYESLPALFLFTKEIEDGIALELGKEWDVDELSYILNDLANCININTDREHQEFDFQNVKVFLGKVDRDTKTLNDIKEDIVDLFSRLFWDIEHTENDKIIVSQFIENSVFEDNVHKELLKNISFSTTDSFKLHPKRTQLLDKCNSYIKLHKKINKNIFTEKQKLDFQLSGISLQDFLEKREIRRKAITEKIESYIKSRGTRIKRVTYKPVVSVNDILDRVNRFSSFGKDIAKSLTYYLS